MSELSKEDIKDIQNSVSIKIGNKIRDIREKSGLTQTELADRIQSDRQYMYKIESAKVGLSVGKLAVIAKALNVELVELTDI
jgi:transcriptional regulator with XRE-family HTH domain